MRIVERGIAVDVDRVILGIGGIDSQHFGDKLFQGGVVLLGDIAPDNQNGFSGGVLPLAG